ncbi:MAG: RAD55 family ATPase [bacterium]
MSKRLTTGLSGLDAQLGGGIPGGSVVLLLGEPMNAHELFTYHFAGGNKLGKCIFVTTSGEDAQIQDGVKAIGAEGAKGRIQVVQLGGAAKDKLPDFGGERYVLDSFSEHVASIGWDAGFARLRALRDQVHKSEGTLLVTATPELHTTKEIALLKLWADGVMELGFDRQGFGLYPYLKVTKMRGVPDSARFLLFKETDKGLFMESTRRVF